MFEQKRFLQNPETNHKDDTVVSVILLFFFFFLSSFSSSRISSLVPAAHQPLTCFDLKRFTVGPRLLDCMSRVQFFEILEGLEILVKSNVNEPTRTNKQIGIWTTLIIVPAYK